MSPEVPKPPKLVLKMELVFLVLKEIKILPSEFIENLWDLRAFLLKSRCKR